MPVIGQFLWPRRPLSEVFGNGLGPKRSVHFSSASRSENTLLPFPTHDNHGLQGSIMLVWIQSFSWPAGRFGAEPDGDPAVRVHPNAGKRAIEPCKLLIRRKQPTQNNPHRESS